MASSRRRALSIKKKLAFAAISVLFFFCFLEMLLRLVNFRHAERWLASPAGMTSWRQSLAARGWEPEPGAGPFNADGFIGATVPKERSAGVRRVALLGDSCTQFGDPPYSQLLADLWRERHGEALEVINAGVMGYSTVQGLRRLETAVLPFKPDAVAIYFGWNDHWMWSQRTDAELFAPAAAESWLRGVGRRLRASRVVQGLTLVGENLAPPVDAGARKVLRVPLADYAACLRSMADLCRSHGAAALFVTAPTNMTVATPSADFPLLANLAGFTTPLALHDAYVDATRRAARDQQSMLVDARVAFAAAANEGATLIEPDHIHPTSAGRVRLATLLADALEQPLASP